MTAATPATPDSVDACIDAFAPRIQSRLRAVRQAVRAVAPQAEERLRDRMPALFHNGVVVYHAAFNRHIGLYPAVADEALRAEVARDAGPKGNLPFLHDAPLPLDLIAPAPAPNPRHPRHHRDTPMTTLRRAQAALLCLTLAATASAPASADDAVITESRTAAATLMATLNFVVGRLGAECLAELGRRETPKAFVMAWRERNADYFEAAQVYMTRRVEAAFETGGEQARAELVRHYTASVRQNGEASVGEWFRTGDRKEACRRAIGAVEAGSLDIKDAAPVAAELKSLVAWAKAR